MSDELAPDAVGEPHATPICNHPGCPRPAHYDDVCGDHVDEDRAARPEADSVEQPPTPLAEGGDPADFTVEVVAAYLKQLADTTNDAPSDAEYVRILELEASGKGRKGILGD